MHIWGDKDFDWEALDKAIEYFESRCRRWARLGIWVKEKYGTMRVFTTCALFMEYDFIHHIFYPGYVSYRFPKWFRRYVDWPFGKALKWMGILYLIQLYQVAVLKYFWKRAAEKWPHISVEILDEYNWVFDEDPNNKGINNGL